MIEHPGVPYNVTQVVPYKIMESLTHVTVTTVSAILQRSLRGMVPSMSPTLLTCATVLDRISPELAPGYYTATRPLTGRGEIRPD